MGRKPYSAAVRERALELYRTGLSIQTVCDQLAVELDLYSLVPATVGAWVKPYARPHAYPEETRRRAIDLVLSGRPVKAVAAEIGCSRESVCAWLRAARKSWGMK